MGYSAKSSEYVKSPIQYGKSVQSISNYLSMYQFVPYKRLQELFHDVFEISISTGTLVSMDIGFGTALKKWRNQIKNVVASSKSSAFDETGFRLCCT